MRAVDRVQEGASREPADISSTGRIANKIAESFGSSLMIWRITSRLTGPLL